MQDIAETIRRVQEGQNEPSKKERVTFAEEKFLPAGQTLIFKLFPFPEHGHGDFIIFTHQRNGEYCQIVGFRQIGEDTAFAYDVFPVVGKQDGLPVLGKTALKSFSSENYPRNPETGKRDWVDNREAWLPFVELLKKEPVLE